jgi:uncharacterized protein YpmB
VIAKVSLAGLIFYTNGYRIFPLILFQCRDVYMKSVLLSVLFLVLGLLYSAQSMAFYQGSPNGNSSKSAKSEITSRQAAQIVKSRFGGKVLKVTRSKSANHPVYRVKLVKDNGHVISVSVDGKTGRIIGS